MSAHLGKIALMIVMTQGFRALGRLSNPRWAGLALGLPGSTAVALVGGGLDRGVDYAVAMSRTSLIGLAGAVALPMAYARAIHRGWRLHWAILIGATTYLTIAISAERLLPSNGDVRLAVASVAVAGAIWASSRIPSNDEREPQPSPTRTSVTIRVLRTIAPIVFFRGSLAIGDAYGPSMGGLMSTFPGVTLTVLLLTHLESGPASALRMARALPVGNLGMLAFLACFRLACPSLGLLWGTILSYVAALATLTLVLTSGLLRGFAKKQLRAWQASICLLVAFGRGLDDSRLAPPSWPRACRRFSPLIESFAV